MPSILIADSGSTKCEWCLLHGDRKKKIVTKGISPYFLGMEQIIKLLQTELIPRLKEQVPDEIYFYGTGLKDDNNKRLLRSVLKKIFPSSRTEVQTDLLAAARALCKNDKGISCILGTGSNSCFYNGKKIIKNNPGLGYILGDEGSGTHLGKKVIQHFLYNTFDEELMLAFNKKYNTTHAEILERVYRQPQPNRYLAAFALFLAENRGHYMIENIIEDGINDFFFAHLCKYRESWLYPIHFTGGVAYGFKDVIKNLCESYEMEMGIILKQPMDGLVKFYSGNILK